jgi:uncharacterized protein YceK
MKPLIAVIAISLVLPGCSSAPVKTTARQYCYTKQHIRLKDGETVSSDTDINCNDDPIAQLPTTRLGMADNCYHMKKFIPRNGQYGQYVETTFIACQDPFTGNWKPVSQ